MKVLVRIINLKAWLAVIFLTQICLLQISYGLTTETNLYTGGEGGNTVKWYYSSPLNVVENITDMGDGSYLYEYSFVNVDTSPIWEFAINTTFVAQPENGFTGHPSWWGPGWLDVTTVYAEFDARNLDPDIVGFIGTYTGPLVDPITAIQIDESASGFSFIGLTYDPSPKFYWYETIESGSVHSNGTGKVAAVGLTIPEPITLFLLGLGGILLRKKRKV